jgi:biotin synthase
MLEVLASFNPPPESVPINALMPVKGTPLGESPPVDIFDMVRMIALARIAVPHSKVRLSAGRTEMSREAQALCFFAGANSIFYGEKLLTAGNPRCEADLALIRDLGLTPQQPQPGLAGPTADPDRPLGPVATA